MSQSISAVLGKLKRVRRNRDGWVACCPAHEDRTPSLSVGVGDTGKILLKCFAGCPYSDVAAALGIEKEEGFSYRHKRKRVRDIARPVRGDLGILISLYKSLLPDSLGEMYLATRGIPLDVALEADVGWCPDGSWPHTKDGKKVMQAPQGRIVFPHTNPDGSYISLYGRAVELGQTVHKSIRHANLPGGKGYFNAKSIYREDGDLYVCEGPFDALSLIASGYRRSIAILGIGAWRDDWCMGVDKVVLALDNDQPGKKYASELLVDMADTCAKDVEILHEEAYEGEKDLNSVLVKKGRVL